MSCPHGLYSHPSSCSQCVEAIEPIRVRIVRLNSRGTLTINGRPAGRDFMPPADVPSSMIEARSRGTRNSARSMRATTRSNRP